MLTIEIHILLKKMDLFFTISTDITDSGTNERKLRKTLSDA